MKKYGIGIDVGGTFTKAVLIDNATHEVVGRFSVLTTHSDPRGRGTQCCAMRPVSASRKSS